jgi:hypothetical protein
MVVGQNLSRSERIQILIAVIGFAATVPAAAITSWDKLFSNSDARKSLEKQFPPQGMTVGTVIPIPRSDRAIILERSANESSPKAAGAADIQTGLFCCDDNGIHRCKVSHALKIATDCYCSEQGAGSICQ